MLTVINKTSLNLNTSLLNDYQQEDILFFDIETTGFSADTTILYLIGCIYFSEGSWTIIQWFADNRYGEKEILQSFLEFVKNYKLLLHYNGDGFDIPYLRKKCEKYHLNDSLPQLVSLDLYKKILPYKHFFNLDHLKQKNIEEFLSVSRLDTYSGKELIQIYGNYLKAKYNKLTEEENLCQSLLLHNSEDLTGMFSILPILSYPNILEQNFNVTKAELTEYKLCLSITLAGTVPKRISYEKNMVYFSAHNNHAVIQVELYKNELKFFYRNYKDYFYLPEEDTAIHKSVAFYVDKDYRTKAKAVNCYSKKTGIFIPQFEEILSPYFKIDFYDKVSYLETTDEFLQNKNNLNVYAKHLFTYLLKQKKNSC